jgi:putative nucleotidyltransferase with HDIG domain
MDVDTICRRVLEETEKILEVNNLSIMLPDSDTGILRARHSLGRDAASANSFTVDTGSSFISQVMGRGTPVTICDIMVEDCITLPYPAKSILCVPLITDNRAIGLLLAADKLSQEEFWSRELKLMGMFAMEIAASIRKAQLYQEISNMFINTVGAFASAIDAKDPYTYGHSRRVSLASIAICEELGLSKKQTGMVELAALLHDIGKIGTPESILHKPGLLKQEEFEKIKEHPGKGAEILSGIKEFSEIITWIRHHHEWYDGRGYPDRVAGATIPIEARIITIADAFDAMTSDRPYRRGMPVHEVLKIMEEYSRSQFDPDILDAFKRVMGAGKLAAIDQTEVLTDASFMQAFSG